MYIGELSLEKLEVYLYGYMSALQVHNIEEDNVPDFRYFYQWLTLTHKVNCAVGGCRQIRQNYENEEEAFRMFFLYANEYSQLIKEIGDEFNLRQVTKRSDDFYELNLGLKSEKLPNSIQVIYLRPGNSCFIRYIYNDNETNDGSMYSDLESALYTINWEFGTTFKKES